ncbi:hypothetical protein, conserved [Eimeria brunetti]|uniref:Uncharacterized protein n=1 Tax=Eimeria brunetti TaxID=51314 RepID=U6LW76_9EIME|nr:hypothetical protein, conserved [Eimeria brunetti]
MSDLEVPFEEEAAASGEAVDSAAAEADEEAAAAAAAAAAEEEGAADENGEEEKAEEEEQEEDAAAAAAAAAEEEGEEAEEESEEAAEAAAAAAAEAAAAAAAVEEALGEPPLRGALAVPLGEAPDLSETAEIVAVSTSLHSIKRQFFSSKRLLHFLDCKGVVYFLIDCNRDISSAMSKGTVSFLCRLLYLLSPLPTVSFVPLSPLFHCLLFSTVSFFRCLLFSLSCRLQQRHFFCYE